MQKKHQRFMEEAFRMAHQALSNQEVPVGAILVLNNKIVGRGFNCVIKTSDPSAHAEIVCLRDAGQLVGNYRLLGCEMYVTLEPCVMCFSALIQARISNLYFAANDFKGGIFSTGKFHAIKEIFNHTIAVKSGIMEADSVKLLQDFFRARRGARAVEWDGLENR